MAAGDKHSMQMHSICDTASDCVLHFDALHSDIRRSARLRSISALSVETVSPQAKEAGVEANVGPLVRLWRSKLL
jgi:hypothetical protein